MSAPVDRHVLASEDRLRTPGAVRAALRALGIDRNTPQPPGGVIYKDRQGNPSGLLMAEPSALILYSTLAQGPKLPLEDQINSTRHFMRELNRLGVTSVIDAGGGLIMPGRGTAASFQLPGIWSYRATPRVRSSPR